MLQIFIILFYQAESLTTFPLVISLIHSFKTWVRGSSSEDDKSCPQVKLNHMNEAHLKMGWGRGQPSLNVSKLVTRVLGRQLSMHYQDVLMPNKIIQLKIV